AIPLQNNPNLVMHLPFDETSGSVAADVSGNGNDGTVLFVDDNGATKTPSATNWTSQGLFGGAVQMDGNEFVSNTIIEAANSPSLTSIQQSMTVMAWVNRDNIHYNVGILSHDYPAMFFGFHNSLYKWEFPTDNGGSAHCYSGYSPAGQWVHIAATYDGATARLFANGVEVCTQAVNGNFNFNSTEPNFSSFTSSGFYERRSLAQISNLVSYTPNGSGVTDEISGKIDELKVYNKVLGPQEIRAFYELGVGMPNVPECPEGIITVEYKLGDGPWLDVNGNNINAPEGSRVYVRAQTTGEYFVTTAQKDYQAPTLSSLIDFTQTEGYQVDTQVSDPGSNNPGRNDGLIDSGNQGQFVITTAGGCPTVINLNVVQGCDPGDEPISAEWRINNNPYQNGPVGENVSITAQVGENVRLSILPNQDSNGNILKFSVTLPNGSIVSDITGDYIMGSVTEGNSGAYILTSAEGCSVIIDLTVDSAGCPDGLSNEDGSLPLPPGIFYSGLDQANGVS
ncbi:LamG domain-containing protein, partial [Maribacter algicola]